VVTVRAIETWASVYRRSLLFTEGLKLETVVKLDENPLSTSSFFSSVSRSKHRDSRLLRIWGNSWYGLGLVLSVFRPCAISKERKCVRHGTKKPIQQPATDRRLPLNRSTKYTAELQ
jgi:hypothetical protein